MSRLRLVLLGLFAVVAMSAIASSSASAALRFFICKEQTGGKYENSLCVKEGATKAWELTELVGLLKVTSHSIAPFRLESKAHGVIIEIKCGKEKDKGWIENPATGNGKDLVETEFEECTVPKPASQECHVAEPIKANANTELVSLEDPTTKASAVYDLFTPDPAGQPFVKIKIERCNKVTLEGEYSVEGKTAGLVHNNTSTLSFSKDMDELIFAGEPAEFEGETLQLTDGGGGIQAL